MSRYPITEIFLSRQGEGFNTGMEAVFVRLSGCNLDCLWCDTDHEATEHVEARDIVARVRATGCDNVIITGGEPTIHDLGPLLSAMKANGMWIALETNGTRPIPKGFDYVAVSPKVGAPLAGIINASEVRVVADGLTDLAQLHRIQRAVFARLYYISPMWLAQKGKFAMMEALRLLGEANAPHRSMYPWLLSIQTHKLAGIQ